MNTPHRRAFASASKFVLSLSMATVAFSAHAFAQENDGVYADHIDWGVMMDMSGPASAAQLPWVKGFRAYMRKINDAGGIQGRKINVLAEDTRYDASLDRVAYDKLANQTPVLGISGVGNSSAQVALASSIRRGKVPVVGTYVTTKAAVEPASPLFYGSFCGFREMAQVGVGFFADKLKLKTPKVAVVNLDVASGKEYAAYIDEAVSQRGGSSQSIQIKVAAADATAQVLEIIKMKPDFVAIHGVPTTAILLMRAMQQYGLNIPTFAITYLGTPGVYEALGPKTGSNYYFVSCFTPADIDESPAIKEMAMLADKYGNGNLKNDGNYVAGWVVGQLAAESIAKAGAEPTRAGLVAALAKGFEVDTHGVSSPLKYTSDNHLGLVLLRPYNYDYDTKRFKAYGNYSDYQKYVK
ncbi:ABC transporter substrate-binding protein [Glaciimonas immobilis]|uniref:Branched-chain amino acid transport system substrate-binding protein n=1 Tax=Glaciimonas immobilis TaxID=728004 RepID=A0A840RVE0_9BURK|nr:ABC transporter substrate-binding protein [Glaciimonas immobilis]KAF3996499.1 ABC transporter substrate-binding protein [Glaciimonas immobilis]MBB5201142.1 branched-chain amino acid transport system substrate-binding protein [Glaciimonas immobilis]